MCPKDSRNNNNKRWGNKFVDKRNWKSYNEELVMRGEFLLPIDMFDSWYEELDKMNEGKKGRPYEFPESFIKIQAVWHQWVDYMVDRIARSLERLCLIPYHDDYTTIWHRVHDMKPEIKLPTYEVEAGSDGTGFKSGNAGEYRTFVYGKIRRKYVKVIITADVRTKKLLAVDVKIGEVSEPKVAAKHIKLLKENGIKLKKFYGDGAYDTNKIFNVIGEAESAVKIRKNATTYRCRGSRRRRQEVREYMKLGYKTWAKKVKYGLRWAIEGIFSSIKRKFGEDLRARSLIGLLAEAMQKVWAYDAMVSYAKNAMLMA